jgi:hypothetical protein
VYDTRFHWRDAPPKVPAPTWIVGGPDWNALVGALGLEETMRVDDLPAPALSG